MIRFVWPLIIIGAAFSFCSDDVSDTGQFQAFSCPFEPVTEKSSSPIGTNLPRISYFNSTHWFFIDAFAKSSVWRASTDNPPYFDNGEILSYDAAGWPTSVADGTNPLVEMFAGIEGHYPRGTYTLYWEGSGATIVTEGGASGLSCSTGEDMASCSSRTATFTVTNPGDESIVLMIRPDNAATYNTSNYIRNIRIIMPGGVCGRSETDLDYTEYCATDTGGTGSCGQGETCYSFNDVYWDKFNDPEDEMDEKVVFHPKSLANFNKYHTIRFMTPFHVVGSTVSDYSERTLLNEHTAGKNSGTGLPYEYSIALANVLNKDLWIATPHLADDNYFDQLSQLYEANLESELNVWVEYSNEFWNPDAEYTQSTYMLNQAETNLALLNLNASDEDVVKRSRFYGYRTKQIHDIWRGNFSDPTRVKRVYATATAFASATQSMFDAPNVNPSDVDAVAIAPYMGVYLSLPGFDETTEGLGLDSLFDELFNGGLTDEEAANGSYEEATGYIETHQNVANNYEPSIQIVAYEGGQHLAGVGEVASNATIQELFEAANRDKRMYELYNGYLNLWRNSGAGLMNHFHTAENWKLEQGTFGAMEFEDSSIDDYPKECALTKFVRENECWWDGC